MDLIPSITAAPGLPALFLLSFLAATILPVGSEWLLVLLIFQGFSPAQVVVTASLGNFFGACTTYSIGWYGSQFFIDRVLRISDQQLMRSKNFYEKYGTWALFFSWVPIIGDPLCLLAGLFRVGFGRFTLLVFTGKFSRYTALAILTVPGTGSNIP